MSRVVRVELGSHAGRGVVLRAFPMFGLYVFRAPDLFLSVRGGGVGQDGNGGHAHVDFLSFELVAGGIDWMVDPGTSVYTPLPDERDAYRSARAHAGVLAHDPPNALTRGLFTMPETVDVDVRVESSHEIVGHARADGVTYTRRFVVALDHVEIHDECGDGTLIASTPQELRAAFRTKTPYSAGYGLTIRPDAELTWRRVVRQARASVP